MDRDALDRARIAARVGEMLAGGAVEEVERALERGASRTARKALGFKEIAAHLAGEAQPRGGARADRARPPRIRAPPAHLDAQARRGGGRSTAQTCRAREVAQRIAAGARLPAALALPFQKWQALGNDYIIVERDKLPFELTPERVRRMCAAHLGCHSDGVLELSPPGDERFVARLRIFNPDGSEAELSGNGAREAVLYLRREGWTDRDEFSIETAAGEVRPTITSAAHVPGRDGPRAAALARTSRPAARTAAAP